MTELWGDSGDVARKEGRYSTRNCKSIMRV